MRWITSTNLFAGFALTDLPYKEKRRNDDLQAYHQASRRQTLDPGTKDEPGTQSEADFSGTTIEVAQLDAKNEKALVLYLTGAGSHSNEIVLWHCASPALKRAARQQALDPLHLLQRVDTQSRRLSVPCAACLSCAQKVA